MKKTPWVIGLLFAVAILAEISGVSFAAPYQPALGGTGTSQIPASGTVLIGNGAGTYTAASLTAGSNVTITNGSGTVTISASGGSSSGTVFLLTGGHGISLSPATITASGTIAINTSTVIADVVASGNFLPSSTTYVASVNGQSGAVTIGIPATTTINSAQATVFKLIGDGTTVTSTVNGTTTTFSVIANTFYPYSSNPANYLTGNQAITIHITGDATGTANGATSITDSLTVTGLQGKALPSLATGTLKYTGGAWTFDGNTYLLSGLNVTTTAPLGGGGALTSAGLTLTCATCLTGNQTITLTGAVTGSGATSIATAYTTSTLFGFFSAVSPIVYNSSTGQFSWTNSNGYISTISINGNSGTSFQIAAGAGVTSTVSGTTTTITLNLSAICSGNQFLTGVSATGTGICGTPSGGASSTNVFGISPIVVTQVGVNATASCPTCIATNTGNWAGTWQGNNPSAFQSAITFPIAYGSSTHTTLSTTTALNTFNWTVGGGNATLTIPAAGSALYAPTTTIPTNTNQLTNGAGFTTNTGTVVSVSAGHDITLSPGTITTTGTVAVNTSSLYQDFSVTNCLTYNTSTGQLGATCLTSAAGTSTITASGTTLTGPAFTFSSSTTIIPYTSGTAVYWLVPANIFYPYSGNPSNFLSTVSANAPLGGTGTSGNPLTCTGCLTSAPATTTINGGQYAGFKIIGDNVAVTSTVVGSTTTFSIIPSWFIANFLPSSTAYVSTVNGASGAITNVAKTNVDNNFSTGQTITGNVTSTGYTNQNVTSSLVGDDANGHQYAYTGSSCGANAAGASISATGTLVCRTVITGINGSGAGNVNNIAVTNADNAFTTGQTVNGNVTSTSQTVSTTLTVFGTSTFQGNVSTTVANALHLSNSSGILTAYTGSSCSGQYAQQISATGTLICASPSGSGTANATGTVGYVAYFTTSNGMQSTTIYYSSSTNQYALATSTLAGLLNLPGQLVSGLYDATATTPTTTVNFSLGERQKIVIGEPTTTLYLSNLVNWGNDQLTVCQDGTGSRTVTWNVSSTNATSSVNWGTAGVPTLSTTANKCDIFSFSEQPMDTNQASSVIYGEYGSNGFSL